MRQPEILAPAGSMESLIAALRCGADAVYVGGNAYSARSSAVNFTLPQLKEAADLCHLYGAKLHLAVNTLLTDREMSDFLEYMHGVAECGVDACIVQDLGVLRCIRAMLPEMELHASTQMSIHTVEGAKQAAALGCSRIVAAREMSCEELRELCRLPVEVEAFVHGALCMSVSGQCSFSAVVGNRSANRGRCAQACRLPWNTPDGRNPAALSLKDLSLVRHIRTLQEMGIASFKIEGRMKRPEYVAAAVTALRMALEGEQPDMETLQAVFSRSGFTDGYFTGRRNDMFGFRRKEDVTAAQDVMQSLQTLYRKPRKVSRLQFHGVLAPDTPALLTVSDSEGNTVTVSGEIPEKALKTPLSAETLKKSLFKLGDTVFEGESVSLKNPDGLTLSASACNAMRRDAAEQLYRARMFRKVPVISSVPVQPGEGRDTQKTPVFRWHIRTAEQLNAARPLGIVCVPMQLAEQCEASDSVWIEAPRIIRKETEYKETLNQLFAAGFRHLICHNLADISIGNAAGFVLHGGYGLNCTNRHTAETLKTLGLLDVTGAYEMRMSSLITLGRTLPAGAFVYGRLPMMLLRQCPIKAQDGCRKNGCYMKDRTGQTFPLVCSGHYMELCNARILWIADKPQLLGMLSFWDMYLTDEKAGTLSAIAESYRSGSSHIPEERTNGLYWKGGIL